MIVIESLNGGSPRKKISHGKEVRTAINKTPVSGAIPLGFLGFNATALPIWSITEASVFPPETSRSNVCFIKEIYLT